MKNGTHYVKQLHKLVEKNGLEALLPQNLPDAIFDRMLKEADAIDNDQTKKIPSVTLLAAILQLSSGTKLEQNLKIEIEPEKLMENFDIFITTLRLEYLRREKKIKIDKSSLPTLKNIFDETRMIKMETF